MTELRHLPPWHTLHLSPKSCHAYLGTSSHWPLSRAALLIPSTYNHWTVNSENLKPQELEALQALCVFLCWLPPSVVSTWVTEVERCEPSANVYMGSNEVYGKNGSYDFCMSWLVSL